MNVFPDGPIIILQVRPSGQVERTRVLRTVRNESGRSDLCDRYIGNYILEKRRGPNCCIHVISFETRYFPVQRQTATNRATETPSGEFTSLLEGAQQAMMEALLTTNRIFRSQQRPRATTVSS
ncbi:hypothetical protein BRC86_10255 [Halobacteriales archaeon QS_3_64_16]|nr:MAG: hypothetical protein BRC86_10255 [Halobacteriales archaeon QS_3_64_16]